MSNEEQKTQLLLSEKVIATIEQTKVAMRPKWHFILKISLLIVGTVLLSLTVLFLASFIIFSLRQSGVWFTPGFGLSGWGILLSSLPWLLISIGVVFLALLGILIKKYSFSYGRPLLYSGIGIIAFAIIGGFLIALTPFHAGLFDRVENGELPFGRGMYEQFGRPDIENVVRGKITEINNSSFVIQTENDEALAIFITPQTVMPRRPLLLEDVVIVLGEQKGDIFEALGIQYLSGRSGLRQFAPMHRNRPMQNLK